MKPDPSPENIGFYGMDLSTTYGPLLSGCFLSCAVWGISSLQAFLYFVTYDKDDKSLKLFVAFLWLLDTVNEILVLKAVWPVLVTEYGLFSGVLQVQPEFIHHIWVESILEFCVQMFFIKRIYEFSHKRVLFPVCMIILSLFQLAVQIPYDVFALSSGSITQAVMQPKTISLVMSMRAVTAAEDIMLAGALIYMVLRNGIPQFKSSKQMTVRLLVITINTGLWTAVFSVIEFALLATYPHGLQFCVMELPLCSLYFGALLANLNSRNYIRQGHTEVPWNDVPSRLVATQRPVVTVTTETIVLGALGKPPGVFEGQASRPEDQKDLEGGQPKSETVSKTSNYDG